MAGWLLLIRVFVAGSAARTIVTNGPNILVSGNKIIVY